MRAIDYLCSIPGVLFGVFWRLVFDNDWSLLGFAFMFLGMVLSRLYIPTPDPDPKTWEIANVTTNLTNTPDSGYTNSPTITGKES